MEFSEIQSIAEYFAPIIYHAVDEPNLPVNADWFLDKTSLFFYDRTCNNPLKQLILRNPTQIDLIDQACQSSCGLEEKITSNGTRSLEKAKTYYLEDLPDEYRKGCIDPSLWTTYFHAYQNKFGGVTIQYWRLHAYNTGKEIDFGGVFPLLPDLKIGFHGGDWEGVHVVLSGLQEPLMINLIGHNSIKEVSWSSITHEDSHPVLFSERGGHATYSDSGSVDFDQNYAIRQETWGSEAGANTAWPGRGLLTGGQLLNVGTKSAPENNQLFIQYSGLWGSPSDKVPKSFPLIPQPILNKLFYVSSGYWGPAYNETQMEPPPSNFITAWGKDALYRDEVLNGIFENRPARVVS